MTEAFQKIMSMWMWMWDKACKKSWQGKCGDRLSEACLFLPVVPAVNTL